MAKTYEDEDGVWRTIGGRRVFIRNGQSLSEAMKESGKFSNLYKSEKKSENKEDKEPKNKAKESAEKHMAEHYDERKKQFENWLEESKKITGEDDTFKKATAEEKEDEKNVAKSDITDFKHQLTQDESDYYNNLSSNEVYELGMKLTEQRALDERQMNIKDKANKLLDGIDRANKKGSGYADKQTEKLRELLKSSKDMLGKEESNKYNADQEDILDYFGEDMGWDNPDRLENLKQQIDDMKNPGESLHQTAKRLAEGGTFLVANDDMEQWLKERNIPVKNNDIFGTYTKEMADRIENLYNQKGSEPVEDRLANNMIVSHYGDDVAYRDKKNNLWTTSREQYNKYVNGEIDKLGGELAFTDEEALKNMIASEGLNRYPYNGYVADEKSGNAKKYKEFVDSEFERLKDSVEDTTNMRAERAKTNPNYAAFKEEKNEGLNKDGSFTQHLDMHGGTREYSADEIKAMADRGIKPLEHSYTGGGWEGVNSDKPMDTKDQAKAITDAMKKKYPDVKISRKSDTYSGGSSIQFSVMESAKDLFISDSDIDKMDYSDFGSLTGSSGFEWWAKDNVKDYDKTHSYNIDDVRRFAKESLAKKKESDIQSVRGNEWYLSDYGKQVMSDLNKEANSYTYSDSDGMVDYFDHGTYMWVNIGKYDKPYKVSANEGMNNKIKAGAKKTSTAESNKYATTKQDVWEKQADGSYKANKEAMKQDYEERHKNYDAKIKQLANDRVNMPNTDWEASVMAYEKQNADGTYKTMQDIMDDVEEYTNKNMTYSKSQAQAMGVTNADIELSNKLHSGNSGGQVKVKGDSNVIPRDFEKGYGKFKVETSGSKNLEDRYEITKDENGYHAKNLRTGETFATFGDHLRNNNVFEFENTSKPKTTNETMNTAIREKANNSRKEKMAQSLAKMYDVDRKTAEQNINFPKDIQNIKKHGGAGSYNESEWETTATAPTSERYSGTIAYLKETGLTTAQINEIIKRLEKDNKK